MDFSLNKLTSKYISYGILPKKIKIFETYFIWIFFKKLKYIFHGFFNKKPKYISKTFL